MKTVYNRWNLPKAKNTFASVYDFVKAIDETDALCFSDWTTITKDVPAATVVDIAYRFDKFLNAFSGIPSEEDQVRIEMAYGSAIVKLTQRDKFFFYFEICEHMFKNMKLKRSGKSILIPKPNKKKL
jgi:hypothetical protein